MLRKKASRYLRPALLLIALLALWQIATVVFKIEDFILPAPSEVLSALWRDRSLLIDDTWVTLEEVVVGFLIALMAGVATACLLHFSPLLRRTVYPLLIASQTVPIIVLAPILVIIFGYTIGPKLAVVALICFFPITVNTLDGLRATSSDLIKMMKTLDAGRWAIFRRVELPSSLPYALSGTRIAATFATIGAVFGEWVGSSSGLGHLMLQATAQLETARVFAAVTILTVIAISLFGLVALAERWLVPWSRN